MRFDKKNFIYFVIIFVLFFLTFLTFNESITSFVVNVVGLVIDWPDSPDTPDLPADCIPICNEFVVCGGDGCGGSCGTCDKGYSCNVEGICLNDNPLPECKEADWESSEGECGLGNILIRTWAKIGNCEGGVLKSEEEISCENIVTVCTPDEEIVCKNVKKGVMQGYENKCDPEGQWLNKNTCKLVCSEGYGKNFDRCLKTEVINDYKRNFDKTFMDLIKTNGRVFFKDKEEGKSLISFDDVDFVEIPENVSIKRSSLEEPKEYLIIQNLTLDVGQTKSIFLDIKNLSSNGVCIADVEISGGADEIINDCIKLKCPSTYGKYSCEVNEDNIFVISGLTHSGVIEDNLFCGDGVCDITETCSDCSNDCGVCVASSSSPSGGGGSGGGSSGGSSSSSGSNNLFQSEISEEIEEIISGDEFIDDKIEEEELLMVRDNKDVSEFDNKITLYILFILIILISGILIFFFAHKKRKGLNWKIFKRSLVEVRGAEKRVISSIKKGLVKNNMKLSRKDMTKIKREVREEIKNNIKKETVKEVNKEIKKEVKKESEKEVKKEVKAKVGKETEKKVKIEVDKELGKEVQKEVKKEVKEELNLKKDSTQIILSELNKGFELLNKGDIVGAEKIYNLFLIHSKTEIETDSDLHNRVIEFYHQILKKRL